MTLSTPWQPSSIALIGCGTIGISWAAYFLSRGLTVVAFDPDEAVRSRFVDAVHEAMCMLEVEPRQPILVNDQAKAVANAELIVENAPEDISLKRSLLATLQRQAPAEAIIACSTSSLRHSEITDQASRPERIVIAHPFNPPHLVPLVELYGPDAELVAQLSDFYESIGKCPIVMRREMIGHVANRLTAALWREALYLLQENVASVADIDRAVYAGPGLRWAIMGPFMTYHLGGGQGGIRHYLEHLGPSQQYRWTSLGTPEMTTELTERVVAGVEAAVGAQDTAALAAWRDVRLRRLQASISMASSWGDCHEP